MRQELKDVDDYYRRIMQSLPETIDPNQLVIASSIIFVEMARDSGASKEDVKEFVATCLDEAFRLQEVMNESDSKD